MSRHPYTYSADYIRSFCGYNSEGCKLSRSDASQIKKAIAEAIGVSDEELAEKLSLYYQDNEDNLSTRAAGEFLRNHQWGVNYRSEE